jgi:hypothetical protein
MHFNDAFGKCNAPSVVDVQSERALVLEAT